MNRKELMNLIREILRITVILDDEISAEERVIRIKHLLVDALTEIEAPIKFGNDDEKGAH